MDVVAQGLDAVVPRVVRHRHLLLVVGGACVFLAPVGASRSPGAARRRS